MQIIRQHVIGPTKITFDSNKISFDSCGGKKTIIKKFFIKDN